MHDIRQIVGIINLGQQSPSCLVGRGPTTLRSGAVNSSLSAGTEWLEADLDALVTELRVVARQVFSRVVELRRPQIIRNR